MKPLREEINMPDRMFPMRMFINSAIGPRVYVHPHWHEEIEVLYVLVGSAVQQVNKRFFNIEKEDLVIIGSDEIHSTYTEHDKNTDILVLQFKPFMLSSTQTIKPEDDLLEAFCRRLSYPRPIKPSHPGGSELAECMNNLYCEWKAKSPAYEMFIKSEIYRFIGHAIRFLKEDSQMRNDDSKNQLVKTMLKKTFNLIDEKYAYDLTLERAACASNLSVSHFCRLFKKCTGMTFTDYLTRYRINMAGQFLESGKNVTEAAYLCGFNSINSFTRAYKRIKGEPPSFILRQK